MTQESISCSALYEGTFSIGTDKVMKPIAPDESAEKGSLKVAVNPFLIRTPKRNILIDAGLGPFGPHDHHEMLCKHLADHGLSEYDITDIFLSHLHYDHFGGLAHRSNGYWELTFPDAKIYTHRTAWQKNMERYGESDEIPLLAEFLKFLDARGDFCCIDENSAEPIPEMKMEVIGGHTEYSLKLSFNEGGHHYIMAGDVLGSSGAVNRRFAAKYDYDGQHSMKLREQITREAWEQGALILCYHDPFKPIIKLDDYDQQQGYVIKSVSYENT